MLEGIKIFLGRDPRFSAVILIGSVITISVYTVSFISRERRAKNLCVVSVPKTVVSGDILYPEYLFSTGPTRYSLNLSGARELTGNSCVVPIPVTEDEYDRHMHGNLTKRLASQPQ